MERLQPRVRTAQHHDALAAIGFVSGQTRSEESRVSYKGGFVSLDGVFFGEGDLTLQEAELLTKHLKPDEILLIIPAYNVWSVVGDRIPATVALASASYFLRGGVADELSIVKIGLPKSPYERDPVALPWFVGGKNIPSIFRDDFLRLSTEFQEAKVRNDAEISPDFDPVCADALDAVDDENWPDRETVEEARHAESPSALAQSIV